MEKNIKPSAVPQRTIFGLRGHITMQKFGFPVHASSSSLSLSLCHPWAGLRSWAHVRGGGTSPVQLTCLVALGTVRCDAGTKDGVT